MTKEEIIEVIRKTIYQFFDVCGDNEEVPISDKDKLLLSVNKAICNNIKALEQEPCEDAVSRQAVIKAVDSHTFDTDDGLCLDDDISCILEDLSSVTPTRKKGKWIYDMESEDWCLDLPFKCSNCNGRFIKSKYCPRCGTEMESEE